MEEGGRRGDAGIGINAFLSVFIHSVDYKIKVSLINVFVRNKNEKSLASHAQDGLDLLHVVVVGHASLAVGPTLEDRLHDGDGAHGEEDGRRGKASQWRARGRWRTRGCWPRK